MHTTLATPLLGGLSPHAFMRRHWQKKPLLIRQALPGVAPPVTRAQLFELAASDAVESRLVVQDRGRWALRHGPFKRRDLPALKAPRWTLLVQGLDLHVDAAHALLSRFRFVPDARLDDLMVSYASDGGGVGPHVDSYDVFLLQLQGRRRWRIGRVDDPVLVDGAPLKILSNFVAEQEWLLEPGDMLYLPPHWAHEGVAQGACMTGSIGFRAAGRTELAREVLQRALDADVGGAGALYRDAHQAAVDQPACIPSRLQAFAVDGLAYALGDPRALACALGEVLSEPKPQVWFEAGLPLRRAAALRLDRRTRMLYDRWYVYINGESYRAAGQDGKIMRRLANDHAIAARDVASLSEEARCRVREWVRAGWLVRGPVSA
jgi:50S ribosomal protein L16 3-hydroxylase